MMLAIIGAALAAAVLTAGSIALWQRAEIGRVAASRRAIDEQWRLIAQVWAQMLQEDREDLHYKLSPAAQTALVLALMKEEVAQQGRGV